MKDLYPQSFKIPEISIAAKKIGAKQPSFIIAEVGVNHNGNFSKAKKLIDAAKFSGADAVKFQTFSVDKLMLKNAEKPKYQLKNTYDSVSQYAMLKKLTLTKKQHIELMRYATDKEIIFLSTPYDIESADFLDKLKIPAFKLSSIEIVNHPFIEYMAKLGKPLILSTGLSTFEEVKAAVRLIESLGYKKNLILLHCNFNYPTRYEEVNLRAMITLSKIFNVHVGFSDHTRGILASVMAVALGARVIEKHITLDKKLPGPDHCASLTICEFANMVKSIRSTEKILGSYEKKPTDSELSNIVSRKSIVSAYNIKKGDVISMNKLSIKRPGNGIWPTYQNLTKIIGRKTACNIKKDTVISWEMIK